MTADDGQRYRRLSLWLDTVEDDLTPRPALDGDREVDVAIVGAGFTGLWTAYALLRQDPALSVLVLERDIAGFGASGRNGGWCSDLFPVTWERLERSAAGRRRTRCTVPWSTASTMSRPRSSARHIDADMLRGGQLSVARTPLQEAALRAEVTRSRQRDDPDLALRWLDAAERQPRACACPTAAARRSPATARGFTPRSWCAGWPARWNGRAVALPSRRPCWRSGRTVPSPRRGTVRARHVVRATEAYTTTLRGERRALLPLYSLMIATEPLPDGAWAEVGWSRGETLNDGRHLLIYAQRTADGRIAFGGRGAPYHFGSRITDEFDREPAVFTALEDALHELIPPTRDVADHPPMGRSHRGGARLAPVGRHRSFHRHRLGGGYVGDGVTAANVAGRTIADLILGHDSELTRLPWVQHRSPRWEPEPLRWLGVNLATHAMRGADEVERRTGLAVMARPCGHAPAAWQRPASRDAGRRCLCSSDGERCRGAALHSVLRRP